MPMSGGDVESRLTFDVSGFSQGVASAQAQLSALDASGEKTTVAFANIESRAASSASEIARAMAEAGKGSNQLDQLAAKSDQAGAKVDMLAQRAADAGRKLSEAMEAARQSGETLNRLENFSEMAARGLETTRQALEEMKAAGTGTAAEMKEAEISIQYYSQRSAELEAQTAALTATHEANTAAVTAAEAKYRQLSAQLDGAQASAVAANDKFAALTETLNTGGEGALAAGLSGVTATLSTLGTSTLTSASRSLGTMATNAIGFKNATLAGTLASRGMSAMLRTLISTLGVGKLALVAAGGAAAYAGYQFVRSRTQVADSTKTWEQLYERIDTTRNVDFKAIANAEIELETAGLADKAGSVYDEIGKALTDGKPDTSKIIGELQGNVQGMFTDVRARLQEWYDSEMARLDLSTAAGLRQAQELTDQYDSLKSSLDGLDASTAGFISEYAGQSTEACKAALGDLQALEDEAERTARRIDELAALANSNQRAAFATAAAGLTTDQTTVANAAQYAKYSYVLDVEYKTEAHEDRLAELWQQVAKASTDAEREALRGQIEAENTAYEQYAAQRKAQYRQQLAQIVQGVAQAAMRTDPELQAAVQRAISGKFENLGDLKLDNPALVGVVKDMVEADILEGVDGVDLSTAEGQMRALIQMLGLGTREAAEAAWDNFVLKDLGAIAFAEEDDPAQKLAAWAEGINNAVSQADAVAVSEYVQSLVSALDVKFPDGTNGLGRAADWIASLNAAIENGADPAALAAQTDALGDLWTAVNQMDAYNPEHLSFMEGLAQALSDNGIVTDAARLADTLKAMYGDITGIELEAPKITRSPVEDFIEGAKNLQPVSVNVPAEVAVEPETVTLPSPDELGAAATDGADGLEVETGARVWINPEYAGMIDWYGDLVKVAEDAAPDPFVIPLDPDIQLDPSVQLPSSEATGIVDSAKAEVEAAAAEAWIIPLDPDIQIAPDYESMTAFVDESKTAAETAVEDPWIILFDPDVQVNSPALPSPEELGFPEWGQSLGQAAADALQGTGGEASAAARSVGSAAASGVDVTAQFSAAGNNAGSAFSSALRSHISSAAAAATAIGSAAYNAMRNSLAIRSPSRKMRQLGAYTGQGYALGISDTVTRSEKAIQRLAGMTMGAAARVTSNDQRTYQNTVNNPIVRGREDVRRLSSVLSRINTEAVYGQT